MPLPLRLSAFYFAHFVHGGGLLAYFPLYLAWRGLGAVEIAWVLALPQLARTFAPAAWGALADRTGARRGIVAFSCLASAVAYAALPFVESFRGIVLVIGVASVLSAAGLPLVETITLGALAGHPGRYGPIRVWGSVGFVLAVLGLGAWLDAAPVRMLPWPLLAFAVAALAVAFTLPQSPPVSHAARVRLELTAPVRALLAGGFCMAAAHATLYAFLTLLLERAGYSGIVIGALWTLGVVAEIAVFVWLPQLFRRFSLAHILVFSFACATVRFLMLGWLAEVLWVLVLAQLLHAASFGAFHAASVAAMHRVVPEAAQARGQTLFSSVAYGAGGAAGALAAGWAWEAGGPALAFSLSALAGLCGLLLAHGLKRAGL